MHSIETRLPFIDYQALEKALSINMKYKIKDGWTKYILRKLINNYLPKKVVWRKNKLGFSAPENIWINSFSCQMKKEILKSKLLKEISNIDKLVLKFDNMNNQLKWRLYNIAIWEKIYDVKLDKND